MRTIVCKDERAAIDLQRALSDARVIWPCVHHFRVVTADVIDVMSDVDLSQDLGGITLAQHIEARQMLFLDPRINILSAHESLALRKLARGRA